jgi:hypothetical protein
MLTRRSLLQTAAATAFVPRALAADATFDPRSWASVRAQFALDPHATNLTTFLLAAHPRPVRDAIARYSHALDRDAKRYLDRQEDAGAAERRVRVAAAISASTPTRSRSRTAPRWASHCSTVG